MKHNVANSHQAGSTGPFLRLRISAKGSFGVPEFSLLCSVPCFRCSSAAESSNGCMPYNSKAQAGFIAEHNPQWAAS